MSESESWLPVVGREGFYEISNRGRARSLDRVITTRIGTQLRWRGRPLKSRVRVTGHLEYSFSDAPGIRKTVSAHVLVLESFVGPRPPGAVVRHLNGDPADNRLENLAWGTSSENALDSVSHGTHNWARVTHCVRGHAFSGDNLLLVPYKHNKGGIRRVCRTCRNDAGRESMRRRRAQAEGQIITLHEHGERPTPHPGSAVDSFLPVGQVDEDHHGGLVSEKTFPEQLDAAQSAEEFTGVLQGLFGFLQQARDEEHR